MRSPGRGTMRIFEPISTCRSSARSGAAAHSAFNGRITRSYCCLRAEPNRRLRAIWRDCHAERGLPVEDLEAGRG